MGKCQEICQARHFELFPRRDVTPIVLADWAEQPLNLHNGKLQFTIHCAPLI